ncbi:hypothetical protein HU727_017385 [Pseudomonas sp. SWRI153]|uniref:Immunity protein n=1 Tax=Pseudomonas khorasanensis TaxID=2745508 RepID=A0A923F515_9PSED|nr:hypothetical protein [Pseudomonas khorasanensis]MBV4487361.1 hypothetical protein [Pseudomonas khorasanensis]
MSTIEMIVKNEPLDDIVTVFALIKATPHLDMMIRIHNRELLKEYGALENAYTRLFNAGVLANGENGLAIKGPNWAPPAYMTEKRYI